MDKLSSLALDLLDKLALLDGDQHRWDFALNRLSDVGFNALNMLCFTPQGGEIHWVRSSMSES